MQGEVAAQALGYVALDHRVEFAVTRLGDRGEGRGETETAEDQLAQHVCTLKCRRR